MIKPDWNIFKAKFSENPQSNFEWLCYLLFCQEFDLPFGIFRYKNQSGIETNPIFVSEKEVIGWQAKFYETPLSQHKTELVETIIKSRRDYPTLTKIIFYTNQEWGQGKDKKHNDPQAKIEVEEKAKKLKIDVEWRTASFFESTFVTINNEIVARHFFSGNDSIFDLLMKKQSHNDSILEKIQTYITFNKVSIEIDRSKLLQEIKREMEQKQVLILTGVGGSGKTAIIKSLYKQYKGRIPFYIFKGNEFELNNIDELYENFSLQDFIEAHTSEKHKIVVIDSAEKLLDLKNIDPFNNFLSSLIRNNWNLLFTTRISYLSDLDMQFIDYHQITPSKFYVENLTQEELSNISQLYKFKLPTDSKLLELLKNPFYLNEYLKVYKEHDYFGYSKFKERLWNKIIKKSKPEREQCFLKIAFQRANEGQFFLTPSYNEIALELLASDGVLGYETAGYFITHDIYEEWALEKIIEAEFIKRGNNDEFFTNIGESIAIRRSFRNWISDKLLLEDYTIEEFIEELIEDEKVQLFWKDEVLVSILLSSYAETFFRLFQAKLLENDCFLLKRLTFLLRIGCKEVNTDFLKRIGLEGTDFLSLKHVWTQPRGQGWNGFIKYLSENLNNIDIKHINFTLPIIHDWNSNFKKGDTTRLSSLIALKFYQNITEKDIYFPQYDEVEKKLIQTILYGAFEIENELKDIFDKVLSNKWRKYRDPYYELIQAVLKQLGDNSEVINVLPAYVLQLANLFWFSPPNRQENDFFYSVGIGPEKDYGLDKNNGDYYPASSFQTPVYNLLKVSFKETLDFILSFTNKTVQYFAESKSSNHELEEIEVFISKDISYKQYISDNLWNIYRGTQVSPDLLKSIHMALERFLLEIGQTINSNALESYLLYMIKNSKSASITAVVVSVVLAYPSKTFNVAKALFLNKELFFYDTHRFTYDQTAKSLFFIGYGLLDYEAKIHQDERVKSCESEHRKQSLENLAVTYQFFREKEISEEEANRRKKIIWEIIDQHYTNLVDGAEKNEDEMEKVWRLYLARMDRRKMEPIVEEKDGKIIIDFNPQLSTNLKEYSENSMNESLSHFKYQPLKLWSDYKMKNDKQSKQYPQYENDPKKVLEEVKVIISKFREGADREFYVFNRSIPVEACSVLVRDHLEELSNDERIFCRDIIFEKVHLPFTSNYTYQIGDGVESAIGVLPFLLKEFPENKLFIKTILLLTLFDNHPIGMHCEFADYSIVAISKYLWDISFNDAQSILFGYLFLEPKYKEVKMKIEKENNPKNVYSFSNSKLVEAFTDQQEESFKRISENQIFLPKLESLENLDLSTLGKTFRLIPLKTNNKEQKDLAQCIISIFAKRLLVEQNADRVDYMIVDSFLERSASLILSAPREEVVVYLRPFINEFKSSEVIAKLLQKFILAEDQLNSYANFWLVWELFSEKIIELSKKENPQRYTEEVIESYLLARTPWSENVKDWHGLKKSNRRFFAEFTKYAGHSAATLYAISKLLNGIGNKYINNGINWIYIMLKNNKKLWNNRLETNTIYYLENITKEYIHHDLMDIRKIKKKKYELLLILDFLVEKGSVVGYMLRERIL